MKRIIKALIPVRSGSKRVENKNLRPFAGSNLLEIKINQLLNVPELDGICVNSNDPTMIQVADSLGVETCLRDPYFATDTVPMSEVYANMAESMECDDILLTHVTNPLADAPCYSKLIEEYRKLENRYDSITTVQDVKEFLYLDGKPLNYDPKRKPRSQDLPEIIKLTHVISILAKELMISRRDIIGNTPLFGKLSPLASIDIDTQLDFETAEFLFLNRMNNNKCT